MDLSLLNYLDDSGSVQKDNTAGQVQPYTLPDNLPYAPVDRGIGGDLLSTGARGLAEAARILTAPLQTLGITDYLANSNKMMQEEYDIFKPDIREYNEGGGVYDQVRSGLQSTVPSLSVAGLSTGLAAAVGISNPIGLAGAGLLGIMSFYGSDTFNESLNKFYEVFDPNGDKKAELEGEATQYAVSQVLAQAPLDAVGGAVDIYTLGMGKAVTQPLKQTLKQLLSTTPKEFGMKYAKVLAAELPTEMAQGAGSSYVDQQYGIETPSMTEAAVAAIIPTLTASLAFTGGAHLYTANEQRKIKNALKSDDTILQTKAAGVIYSNLKQTDPEVAELWNTYAQDIIHDTDKSFNIEENFVELGKNIIESNKKVASKPLDTNTILNDPDKTKEWVDEELRKYQEDTDGSPSPLPFEIQQFEEEYTKYEPDYNKEAVDKLTLENAYVRAEEEYNKYNPDPNKKALDKLAFEREYAQAVNEYAKYNPDYNKKGVIDVAVKRAVQSITDRTNAAVEPLLAEYGATIKDLEGVTPAKTRAPENDLIALEGGRRATDATASGQTKETVPGYTEFSSAINRNKEGIAGYSRYIQGLKERVAQKKNIPTDQTEEAALKEFTNDKLDRELIPGYDSFKSAIIRARNIPGLDSFISGLQEEIDKRRVSFKVDEVQSKTDDLTNKISIAKETGNKQALSAAKRELLAYKKSLVPIKQKEGIARSENPYVNKLLKGKVTELVEEIKGYKNIPAVYEKISEYAVNYAKQNPRVANTLVRNLGEVYNTVVKRESSAASKRVLEWKADDTAGNDLIVGRNPVTDEEFYVVRSEKSFNPEDVDKGMAEQSTDKLDSYDVYNNSWEKLNTKLLSKSRAISLAEGKLDPNVKATLQTEKKLKKAEQKASTKSFTTTYEKDSDGVPVIKQSQEGVLTSSDGRYTITGSGRQWTLEDSTTGFKTLSKSVAEAGKIMKETYLQEAKEKVTKDDNGSTLFSGVPIIEIAKAYYKAGMSLIQFSKKMADKVGAAFNYIKPQIKELYNKVREFNKTLGQRGSVAINGDKVGTFKESLTGEIVKKKEQLTPEEAIERDKKILRQSNTVKNKFYTSTLDYTKQAAKKYLQSATEVLGEVHPQFKVMLKNFEHNVNKKALVRLDKVKQFRNKVTELKKDNIDDYYILDLALKNLDIEEHKKRFDSIVKKYKLEDSWKDVREVLDELQKENVFFGLISKVKPNYFPRKVADFSRLMEYVDNNPDKIELSEEVRKLLSARGIPKPTQEQIKDVYKSLLIKGDYPAMLRIPGYVKKRTINQVNAHMNQFYEPSLDALMNQIKESTDLIEQRRLIGASKVKVWERQIEKINAALSNGNSKKLSAKAKEKLYSQRTLLEIRLQDKDLELTNSISDFLAKLTITNKIKPEKQKLVRDVLRARFNQKGMSKGLSRFKDMGLISALGTPLSTVTQVSDFAHTIYKRGPKIAVKSLFGDKLYTRKDFDFTGYVKDLSENNDLSKILDKILTATQFKRVDSFFKEVSMQAAFEEAKAKGKPWFVEQYSDIYGEQTEQLYKDIVANKKNELTSLFAFYELSEMQPISMSEMPIAYLEGGKARLLYALKSYNLKTLNNMWRDSRKKFKAGDKIGGMRDLARYMILLTFAGATADELKQAILGQTEDFSDNLMNNILKLFLVSRYSLGKTKTTGVSEVMKDILFPPTGFIDNPYKDFISLVEGEDFKFNTLNEVPIAGKFLHARATDAGETKNYKKLRVKISTDLKDAVENGGSLPTGLMNNIRKYNKWAVENGEQQISYLKSRKRILKKLKKDKER